MSEWQTYRIADLGYVVTGKTPATNRPELLGRGTAFVTPTDISEQSIYAKPQRRLSPLGDVEFKRLVLPRDTICFTCIASIGKMCLTLEPTLTNQQINSLVVDRSRIDPRWAFYSLKAMREEISAIASGAATPIINKTAFSNILLSVPPFEIQGRIASILGAYDDLIEVNRRRITVLEEMARGLFDEWFVRFRFPGHEDVPIPDTPDGPLPQGWRWGSASDLIAFDPRTPVPRDGLKPFIPMGHLDTATSLIALPEERSGNAGAKFRNGDTLFARITPCLENGKTGLVRGLHGSGGIGFGSTEFIVMRGEVAGAAFTYCLARHAPFRDNARASMSGATGRQRSRTESLASFEMAIPELGLLRQFEADVWPMLELVGELGIANRNLAAARDLLLPRLISGQLSVAQAERELDAA